MLAAFADGGPLARAVPDFEPRPGQREMAAAVADVFARGGVLLVEAGTGTGKTLAYLAPAILSGHRVLVSTGTKNLQEQVYGKDLPLLARALGVHVTATCMKGRGNYLCLHRYESLREGHDEGFRAAGPWIPLLDGWAARTDTGDRAELEDLPEDLPFWSTIAASAENCIGTECPRHAECFVTRMRQRAAASDVVIVNHHLLCADAAVRQSAYGEVIPGCAYVVIDEAHQLEDVATQYFGIAVSNHRVDDLVRDGERCLALDVLLDDPGSLREAVDRIRECSRSLFAALALVRAGRGADDRLRLGPQDLSDVIEEGTLLTGALDRLEAAIHLLRGPEPTGEADDGSTGARISRGAAGPDTSHEPPLREDLLGLSRRAADLRDQLRFLLRADDPDFVYFLDVRGRSRKAPSRADEAPRSPSGHVIVLRAAPIDVSAIVREVLFNRMQATVLTSATLTVEGSFEYVRSRLGVDSERPIQLRLPSEFDYARQAILYLPRRMPDPRSAMFPEAAAREVLEIVGRTRGRAFVLFTSYATLRAVRTLIEALLPFPLFVQGEAPRSVLLGQFRSTPHAVLLATSSFWQGVDVIGEALSCVIVDKLPFASPGDPITAARMEAVQLRGGNAFSDYQVPLAILTLQQGLGRLIRHRQDRGVLAVLDPRLTTKAYGRQFLASLPPARVTRALEDIREFLA